MDRGRAFTHEVQKLAKKYAVNFFVVTDGVSKMENSNESAVKNAIEAHKEWQNKIGRIDEGNKAYGVNMEIYERINNKNS